MSSELARKTPLYNLLFLTMSLIVVRSKILLHALSYSSPHQLSRSTAPLSLCLFLSFQASIRWPAKRGEGEPFVYHLTHTLSSSKRRVKWRISANWRARACSCSKCCVGLQCALVRNPSRPCRAPSAQRETTGKEVVLHYSCPDGWKDG